jgi:hypothetical protein
MGHVSCVPITPRAAVVPAHQQLQLLLLVRLLLLEHVPVQRLVLQQPLGKEGREAAQLLQRKLAAGCVPWACGCLLQQGTLDLVAGLRVCCSGGGGGG